MLSHFHYVTEVTYVTRLETRSGFVFFRESYCVFLLVFIFILYIGRKNFNNLNPFLTA